MPLYTYLIAYRDDVHVEQASKSNFKGFAAGLVGDMPENALPGLTMALRRVAVDRTYRAEWAPLPNRKSVWRASFDLNGSDFVLYAVQTDG